MSYFYDETTHTYVALVGDVIVEIDADAKVIDADWDVMTAGWRHRTGQTGRVTKVTPLAFDTQPVPGGDWKTIPVKHPTGDSDPDGLLWLNDSSEAVHQEIAKIAFDHIVALATDLDAAVNA